MTDMGDGLITPEIGPWGEYEKYRLMSEYSSLFVKGMRRKWDHLIYIDLFSGAGKSKIRGENRVVLGSPLLALTQKHPFDKLIFCEKNEEKFSALVQRVEHLEAESKISFVNQDANLCVEEIVSKVPKGSKNNTVLSFCFVDPYMLSNLQFDTIRNIADRIYVDFMVLIPSGMDANRNLKILQDPKSSIVEDFTGRIDWRAEWDRSGPKGDFRRFIVDAFGQSMKDVGFEYNPIENPSIVRSNQNNLYLYDLVFFSKSKMGTKFWEASKTASSAQKSLF